MVRGDMHKHSTRDAAAHKSQKLPLILRSGLAIVADRRVRIQPKIQGKTRAGVLQTHRDAVPVNDAAQSAIKALAERVQMFIEPRACVDVQCSLRGQGGGQMREIGPAHLGSSLRAHVAHHRAFPTKRADRHPASEGLAQHRQIRRHAKHLLRATRRGAKCGEHFVKQQQRPVRIT